VSILKTFRSKKILKLYAGYIYPKITNIRGSYRLLIILETIFGESGDIAELNIKDTRISAPKNTDQVFGLKCGITNYDELDQIQYILDNCTDDQVFVDVGGSFGLYSSIIANRTNCKVYCYEPLPLNVKFQELNKELFNYDFVTYQKAVSDSQGKVSLSKKSNTHGQNTIGDAQYDGELEVESVRLDDKHDHIDYVKIDVEGAELSVLKGMEHILESCEPVILLELHDSLIENYFNYSVEDVVNYLESKGYEVRESRGSMILEAD
jgi:FkbM family methyltransferase